MASHDAGWEAFRHELRRWMELRRITSRSLAARLNELDPEARFDEHVVKRWRHSTAPPLATVRDIAAVLAMSDDPHGRAPHDPAFLLRRMGLLDDRASAQELLDTAFRLQDLRLQLLDVRARLGEHSVKSGAGQLVQTALSHGYAAAVFPVWDGPLGYPMHVADRIDFRTPRADLPPVEDHPDMQAALVATFAVPGERTPRFSTNEDDLAGQSHWAIQLVGRPFSRSGKAFHAQVPAIAVSSATPGAWPDDVGAILAWLLGYGFVTTREVAREMTRIPIATDTLRNAVHEQFLARSPAHHVWSHHSSVLPEQNPHAPWAAVDAEASRNIVHVRLVEDDALLEWTSPYGRDVTPEEAVATAQRSAQEAERRLEDAALAQVRERVLLVPTPRVVSSAGRWDNVMNAVLRTTHLLADLGLVDAATLETVHDRFVRDEPDIAPSLLRWLADHDSPLVSAKFSSRSTSL